MFFKSKKPTQPSNRTSAQPILFIGLGNPGPKYERNRHNLGFMAIDAIAKKLGAPGFNEKFGGELSRVDDLYLFKPMTFMNNSGVPGAKLASFYKIPPERVYVFHDELDVALGKIKIKQGGGDGGHNGLKSLDAHLGKNYWRVRLGINHPGNKDMVHSHVLSDFYPDEEPVVEKCAKTIAENVQLLIQGKRELFLTKYFETIDPPKPKNKQTNEAGN